MYFRSGQVQTRMHPDMCDKVHGGWVGSRHSITSISL
jgi:hypothetical protein